MFSKEFEHDVFSSCVAPINSEQSYQLFFVGSGEGGIQCHADDAQVNLNFWVTPDESNTDLSRGGLVVWHTEPERRFEEDGGEYKHAPTKTVLSQAI